MGFGSYGNRYCKAIRLHYACAYAILISMPVVLFSLFDHVTAHRSDTLRELTAEEIFKVADFLKNTPKQKCNHTFPEQLH